MMLRDITFEIKDVVSPKETAITVHQLTMIRTMDQWMAEIRKTLPDKINTKNKNKNKRTCRHNHKTPLSPTKAHTVAVVVSNTNSNATPLQQPVSYVRHASPDAPVRNPSPPPSLFTIYDKMTLQELRDIARSKKLPRYYDMRKAELLETLLRSA